MQDIETKSVDDMPSLLPQASLEPATPTAYKAVRFLVGDEVTVKGIPFRVQHINIGKKRLTLVPLVPMVSR